MKSGNTRIDHDLLEAIYRLDVPSLEIRLILWVCRNTIGWRDSASGTGRKLRHLASYSEACTELGCSISGLRRALTSLQSSNIVSCEQGAGRGLKSTFALNLNSSSWVPKIAPKGVSGETPLEPAEGVSGETPLMSLERHLLNSGETPFPPANPHGSAPRGTPKESIKEKKETPKPPEGAGASNFESVERLLYSKLSKTFYRAPGQAAPRIAQSDIRAFVLAYGDNVKAAVIAVQQASAEVQAKIEMDTANGRPHLLHPIKPVLNLATLKLDQAGVQQQPRGETA